MGAALSVTAIGSTETVEPLRLLGFDVIRVHGGLSQEDVEMIVSKILESRVALVENEIYSTVKDRLRQVLPLVKEPPLLVVIPSSEKASTGRLEELYNMLSLAVGVRLKWVKKE